MSIVDDFWTDDTSAAPTQDKRLMYHIGASSERIHAQNQLRKLSEQLKQTSDPIEQAGLWQKMADLQWAVDQQPIVFEHPVSSQPKPRPEMTKKERKRAKKFIKKVQKLCKRFDMAIVNYDDYGMQVHPSIWLAEYEDSQIIDQGISIVCISSGGIGH